MPDTLPSTPRPRITHVIWDMDGTLLDTEPHYLSAGNEMARRYGRVLTPEVREQMMGRPGRVAVRIFLDALDIPHFLLDGPDDLPRIAEAARLAEVRSGPVAILVGAVTI